MSLLNELSDTELIGLLKSGDHDAFAEIYERYKYILHNHAYKKLTNREEARDVVQDVFTMLWNKREIINMHSNLSGYLYTALKNSILNLFSHREVKTKYTLSMERFSVVGNTLADYRIREQQLSELIEAEIAALPTKMREVFELSRKSHLTHKEIAERLDICEKTVDRQISNALKILRTKFGLFVFLILLIKF
ncbi:MAG: polymerase subunit sigma-70 [Mucilaginibacter sp.]|nr:polymerase subunit sigma-70 [Mucilaginibacter sp.]